MAILIKNGESVELARVAHHSHLAPQLGSILQQIPVIGTIQAFYDFNGALTFNTEFFAYCNGQSKSIEGLGMSTLPDLSGRYLVGFGTDGGENNHNAVWATTAVGNAGHTINLQHSHTVNSHSHTVNSHSHTGPSHTHGAGTLKFQTGYRSNPGGELILYDTNGDGQTVYSTISSKDGGGAGVYRIPVTSNSFQGFFTAPGSGSSAAGGTGSTGSSSPGTSSASPGTSSSLDSAQLIQPRSIRVRYIMRIK